LPLIARAIVRRPPDVFDGPSGAVSVADLFGE